MPKPKPKPNDGEMHDDWMTRCMADETMMSDAPDHDGRLVMCETAWGEKSMPKRRAYSLLTIKAVNEDQRIIEGVATTPIMDRMGDIVDSEGANFKLPLPLLWQHDSDCPIGHVIAAKVTPSGITIKAQIAKVTEPGMLMDRLDMAWQSLKAGLVRGLSIGFMPLENSRIKDTWSEHYTKWDWYELSCVTIPANMEASIISVKSIDQRLLAASMRQHPVVRLSVKPCAAVVSTVPASNRKKGVVYL